MGSVKRKPKLVKYIMASTGGFFVLMMLGMTALMMYTTDQAVEDVARRTAGIDAGRAARHVIKSEEGTYFIDPEMRQKSEDCFVVLLSEDMVCIDGKYPPALQEVVISPIAAGKRQRFRVLETDEGRYYIFDHRVMMIRQGEKETENLSEPDRGNGNRPEDAEAIYARAILCADDFHTIYQDIRRIYFIFLLLLLCMFGIGAIWIYRRMSRPMQRMCDSVQMISGSPDYSERIEDTGPFYETEIMTNAYNHLLERTERLARQQREFNENVSHELRTPTALIRSECELIEDLYGQEMPEKMAEALSVIHKQGERMNAMIAELLYLSRVEREETRLHLEEVDLIDIAASAYEDAEDMADGRWTFVLQTDPAPARIDVTLIMIAVRNLLSNAMKYSPEGSRIIIATGRRGNLVWLRVQDEGIGISEEELKKIFEPYYQVRGERNSDGFGLGLVLVKKIAEKHGGKVEVHSGPEQGSDFTIYLPVSGEAPSWRPSSVELV